MRRALVGREIDDIIAFLNTLTDGYEAMHRLLSRSGTGMILQLLPSDKRAASDLHPGVEDDKTRPPISKLRPDRGQCLRVHCGAGVWHTVGQQYATDWPRRGPRPRSASPGRCGQRAVPEVPSSRPRSQPAGAATSGAHRGECNPYECAGDLRPVQHRVDREAYSGTRQPAPRRPFDMAALQPGGGEVIRCIRPQQIGIFNSAHEGRRQKQILCSTD